MSLGNYITDDTRVDERYSSKMLFAFAGSAKLSEKEGRRWQATLNNFTSSLVT